MQHLRMRNQRTDRYALLLLLIMLTVASIAASDAGTWGRVVTMLLISATMLLALRTSNARRVTIWIAFALSLIGITASLVSATTGGGETVDWVTNAMAVMLAAVVPIAIAREIWRHPKVTPETVMGALCIYLLLGVMFALGFAIIADAGNDPYFVQTENPTAADYVYFSYVTMATVGYGDLTARSSLGRMAAALEGLVGQLYLVTVVALLVSNLGHERTFRRQDAPDDDSS
jgi:Ion channel